MTCWILVLLAVFIQLIGSSSLAENVRSSSPTIDTRRYSLEDLPPVQCKLVFFCFQRKFNKQINIAFRHRLLRAHSNKCDFTLDCCRTRAPILAGRRSLFVQHQCHQPVHKPENNSTTTYFRWNPRFVYIIIIITAETFNVYVQQSGACYQVHHTPQHIGRMRHSELVILSLAAHWTSRHRFTILTKVKQRYLYKNKFGKFFNQKNKEFPPLNCRANKRSARVLFVECDRMQEACETCQLDLVLINASMHDIRYQGHFDSLALDNGIKQEIKLNDEYLCGYFSLRAVLSNQGEKRVQKIGDFTCELNQSTFCYKINKTKLLFSIAMN